MCALTSVEGRLQTRSYDDKEGKKVYATEVIAEEVVLLGGQAEGQSGEPQAARAAAGGGVGKSKASGASDDDLSDMHITDNDVPF
jgi:single-strand DNA-binding protein